MQLILFILIIAAVTLAVVVVPMAILCAAHWTVEYAGEACPFLRKVCVALTKER